MALYAPASVCFRPGMIPQRDREDIPSCSWGRVMELHRLENPRPSEQDTSAH